ncbi:MAG: hypothetical protein J7641_03250 [Cyanobacteria bacterium SID2]|nr:hypothetical protein [Cyanobacteria bacterium SID2]MBP0004115.1 hypothetical protein [Cyanobacteria bacterium SBC]
MGRRIVTRQLQAGKPNPPVDRYADRLLKYIPADVVAFWLAVNGSIQSAGDDVPKSTLLWILFIFGVFLTLGWTFKQTQEAKKKPAWTQIGISCVAFVVWVFAIGGPFAELSFYTPLYGSLLLLVYTSTVALITPPEK